MSLIVPPLPYRLDLVFIVFGSGSVRLQVSLAIAVIGTARGELGGSGLTCDDYSLRALELHTDSCPLLPRHSPTTYRAKSPTGNATLYRPIEDRIAVRKWTIGGRNKLFG